MSIQLEHVGQFGVADTSDWRMVKKLEGGFESET